MSSSTHNTVLLFLQSEPQGLGRGLVLLDSNVTSENRREDALEWLSITTVRIKYISAIFSHWVGVWAPNPSSGGPEDLHTARLGRRCPDGCLWDNVFVLVFPKGRSWCALPGSEQLRCLLEAPRRCCLVEPSPGRPVMFEAGKRRRRQLILWPFIADLGRPISLWEGQAGLSSAFGKHGGTKWEGTEGLGLALPGIADVYTCPSARHWLENTSPPRLQLSTRSVPRQPPALFWGCSFKVWKDCI